MNSPTPINGLRDTGDVDFQQPVAAYWKDGIFPVHANRPAGWSSLPAIRIRETKNPSRRIESDPGSRYVFRHILGPIAGRRLPENARAIKPMLACAGLQSGHR
jgi:hypothetical protein